MASPYLRRAAAALDQLLRPDGATRNARAAATAAETSARHRADVAEDVKALTSTEGDDDPA